MRNGASKIAPLIEEASRKTCFGVANIGPQSVLSPILVVAVQLELFQKLRDAGPAGVTTDSLSIRSPYHRHQLDRILRHLKASSVIDVLRPSVWLATSLSNELATPHFQHSILFCHYTTRQAFNGLPEYFSRMSKEDPSAVPGPFQIGMESPLGFFPWLAANPKQATYFNHFMQAYRAGNAMWFEPGFYPVSEHLDQGFNSSISDVFLVDVGGGKGHDLAAFAATRNSLPGKLILQDQPSVIAEIPASHEHLFETRAHDFFTPQPILSARAYFLHSVLHDWGDEDCLRILENLKPALKPGYSRVLFNEIVLSEEEPTLHATSMDMMMLSHCDPAYERTERAWTELLHRAGYVVRSIFGNVGAAESIIEAEVI